MAVRRQPCAQNRNRVRNNQSRISGLQASYRKVEPFARSSITKYCRSNVKVQHRYVISGYGFLILALKAGGIWTTQSQVGSGHTAKREDHIPVSCSHSVD